MNQQQAAKVQEVDLDGLPDWEIEVRAPGKTPVILRPKNPGQDLKKLCWQLKILYDVNLGAMQDAHAVGDRDTELEYAGYAKDTRKWAASLGCAWARR